MEKVLSTVFVVAYRRVFWHELHFIFKVIYFKRTNKQSTRRHTQQHWIGCAQKKHCWKLSSGRSSAGEGANIYKVTFSSEWQLGSNYKRKFIEPKRSACTTINLNGLGWHNPIWNNFRCNLTWKYMGKLNIFLSPPFGLSSPFYHPECFSIRWFLCSVMCAH